MQAIDPIYEEGCAAGRSGVGLEQNPYAQTMYVEGTYSLSQYDRWAQGWQRGRRWCTHCNGTGQLPDVT